MTASKTVSIELKIPDSSSPVNNKKAARLSLMAHLEATKNRSRYDKQSTLSKIIILQRPRTGKQRQQSRSGFTTIPMGNFMTRRKFAMSGNFNIHEDRKLELSGRTSEFASRKLTTKDLVWKRSTQNKLQELIRLDSCDQAAFKHIVSAMDSRQQSRDFTTGIDLQLLAEFLSTMTIAAKKRVHSQERKANTASIYLKRTIQPSVEADRSTSRKKPFYPITDMSACFDERLHKYQQFLFLINLSNRIYRNLYVEMEKPLKFAVGNGNNPGLIRSIMGRRFWWEESQRNPTFVWSQIKNRKLHSRQKPQEKSYLEMSFPAKTDTGDAMFVNKTEQAARINTRKMVLRLISKDDWKFLNAQLSGNKQRFSSKVRRLNGYVRTVEAPYSDCMVTNHLKCNGLLGNKKALFLSLKLYYSLVDDDLWKYLPETYHIRSIDSPEFDQFCTSYNRHPSKVWIVKPGEDTNRGYGITILNTIGDIAKVINKEVGAHAKDRTWIVQHYINEPLLYQKRKFDIRAYMMLTCSNGILKGYWYQEGYIRTSGYLFSLDELSNTYKHLTNDAIQKHSQNYGKYEKGNKIGYTDFQRYLQLNGSKHSFDRDVYPHMKKIATDTIRATALSIDPQKLNNNFEVFGLDFMIDSRFKVYLIEVNTNPCLETGCPTLDRVIPNMLENAFRIGLDPIFPPPLNFPNSKKHCISQNAMFHNSFELVYDQLSDGAALQQLYTPRAREQLEELSLMEEEEPLIYGGDCAVGVVTPMATSIPVDMMTI